MIKEISIKMSLELEIFKNEMRNIVFKILKWSVDSIKNKKDLLSNKSISDLFQLEFNWSLTLYIIENIKELGYDYILFLTKINFDFDTITMKKHKIFVKKGLTPGKNNNINIVYVYGKMLVGSKELNIKKEKFELYRILINNIKETKSSVELLDYIETEEKILNIIHILTPDIKISSEIKNISGISGISNFFKCSFSIKINKMKESI